ncbi:MAG: OmpA family protein [Clostridiales bacterium]|nr:OmpA family protein [Candidatus Blautia equi]
MRKRKSEDGGFNIWRSYSDMMAGVLLLFMLIMCVTLFQAQKSYNDTIQERDEKIAMQERYTLQILQQQEELQNQAGQIEEQESQLKEQESILLEQENQLKDKETLLNEQEALLAELVERMEKQKAVLDSQTTLLTEQQQKIDKIIGVKAEVVASLKKEFAGNNVNVNIDPQTGALALDANVMFDYDSSDLTDSGKNALREILPIYCKVLLQDSNKQYLAEIMIEGHTDPDGDYAYNMELSQKRSLSVANYLLEIQHEFLNNDQIHTLESYLTVNGHSAGTPVFDEQGNIDKDASRRVEVKFRLKDDEMITELSDIMAETKDVEQALEEVDLTTDPQS